MRIACVGGGPAGLYFSIVMKAKKDEAHEITVLERDPSGQTYGWGVVYSEELLAKLHASDPRSAAAIRESSFRWEDQVVYFQGKAPAHIGGHGFAIGRQRLLTILAERAQELGVELRFNHEVADDSQLAGYDLVIAGDGRNSRLRRPHPSHYGTKVRVGRNKYTWLGTRKVFRGFTFPFVRTDAGWIWFHAYGYGDEGSTCVVECPPETWSGLGLDRLGTEASLALLEDLFQEHLDGHRLMCSARGEARIQWLNFPTLTCERWWRGNTVLVGDSAHTTHFSIGSGTKLAMEDAIALAANLRRHRDLKPALESYTRERRSGIRAPQRAARLSGRWFENVPLFVGLDPSRFATLFRYRCSRFLSFVPAGTYPRLRRASERLAGVLQQ